MKVYLSLSPIALLLVGANPALAQSGVPPCPPPIPELATIVDTQLKCNCFYSLAASGFEPGNPATFDNVFTDESVQNFAQTGAYYGADGIAEYLSFVQTEDGFVTNYARIGNQLVLDFTGSTVEQCVATVAERRQLTFNPDLTIDNQEICADTVVGSVLSYTLTGNPAKPITIQKINAYLPDDVLFGPFLFLTRTPAALEFICDTIVNTCDDTALSRRALKEGKDNKKTSKNKTSKKTKDTPKPTEIETCVRKLKKLPGFDSGALTYIDGNSIGCRVLHSVFARANPIHCPHITFEGEADLNGKIKCEKSEQILLTDLFTLQQLGMFDFAATVLGLPPSGITVSSESCSGPPSLGNVL